MFTRFVIFLLSSLGVIGAASYGIYRAFTHLNTLHGSPARILMWLLIAMPILFIGTTVIGMRIYSPVVGPIYAVSSSWLPILAYLFISAIILTVLNFIYPGAMSNTVYKNLSYVLLTTSFLIPILGIINAQTLRTTVIKIPKENRLHQNLSGKKIVLVADSHIGNIYGKKFMDKLVKKVNSENPDMVFFAGDIIDGPKFKMEESLLPIKDFVAPDGVYYASGNHEVYSGDEKNLYNFIGQYVTGLYNQKISIYGVDIIGLTYDVYENDQALKDKLYSSQYDPKNPTIVIHHDPKQNLVLQNESVDLIVSGHTHGGQFWPFTSIVKAMFREYYHGINTIGTSSSVTTYGAGTWGPPVRIGTRAEIISITFE